MQEIIIALLETPAGERALAAWRGEAAGGHPLAAGAALAAAVAAAGLLNGALGAI